MSYFDHVSCPQCKAAFDPEKIASGPGQPMACPSCGAAIGLTDLFGLKDAFAEEDQPSLGLDDLSPDSRETPVWTDRGGYAPDPLQGQMPLGGKQKRPAKAKEEKPWDRGRGHVVPQGAEEDSEEPGASALDIMKRMKK